MVSISFNDFQKLELKVAEITSAEPVLGASRLLKLSVDIGGEARTLAAGIAEHYKPEELVGRKIIVVANLEPKLVRGIASHGMLLAADAPGKIVLITADKDVPAGTPVR